MMMVEDYGRGMYKVVRSVWHLAGGTLGSVFLKLMESWMETACLYPMGLSASENSHPWLS